MPDGSIAVSLPLSLSPRSGSAYDELAFALALDAEEVRREDLVVSDGYEDLSDLKFAALDRALISPPTSMRDALAVLYLAASFLREAVDQRDNRTGAPLDGCLALGRVLRFLADQAGVSVE